MLALHRNVKVTCGNCGTSVRSIYLDTNPAAVVEHCIVQIVPISLLNQEMIYYHIAKKHATPPMKNTHNCKYCFKEFSGFYALRQHKTSEHGLQMKSAEFDVSNLLEDEDADLKEELQACQHFLVDSELEKGRHRVFNFAMSTFDNTLINTKLDLVFNGLKWAAKVNLAFGFVLKNVEDGSCRYFYAHENNTLMERSNFACTPDDIINLKEKLQKMDIVDLCTRERANTKWKFYKLTNLTVFVALLKNVPMGCNDSVLPEPLLKNQNVNCLTFEKNTRKLYNDNLCLFRAVDLHLFGNERLEEETSKIFNLFLNNCGEADPSKFQGVHMTDIPKVEEQLQLNIFLYDIGFVNGELIGELARSSIQKFEKSVKLLRYNNHICYVSDMKSHFKSFCCSTCDTIFSKTGNLERHLITCSERVKHIYPKNVYQLRETLSEKLHSFNIPYREDQKMFKNLAVFDFESICNKEETYKETETTKWIGKHVPISVSISSNLIPEPIFLCNSDPLYLVSSFISTLEGLATQSKAQMKLRFIEVECATKIKLYNILQQLNQRHSQ